MTEIFQFSNELLEVLSYVDFETLKSLRETGTVGEQLTREVFRRKLQSEFGYGIPAPGKTWLQSYIFASQKLYYDEELPIPREPDGYLQQAETDELTLVLLTNGSLYASDWQKLRYLKASEISNTNFPKLPGIYSRIFPDTAISSTGDLYLFKTTSSFNHIKEHENLEGIEVVIFENFVQMKIPTPRPVVLAGDIFFVDDQNWVHVMIDNDLYRTYKYESVVQLPIQPLQIKFGKGSEEDSFFGIDGNFRIFRWDLQTEQLFYYDSPENPKLLAENMVELSRFSSDFIIRGKDSTLWKTDHSQQILIPLISPFQGKVEGLNKHGLVTKVGSTKLQYNIQCVQGEDFCTYNSNYNHDIYLVTETMILGQQRNNIDRWAQLARGEYLSRYLKIGERDVIGNNHAIYSEPGKEFDVWILFDPTDLSINPPAIMKKWYNLKISPFSWKFDPKSDFLDSPVIFERRIFEFSEYQVWLRVYESAGYESYYYTFPK